MEHHDILPALSEIAIAITGFSGIVAALMQGAVPDSELSNRVGIGALLGTSLTVALFGFVPDLMNSAFGSETTAWHTSTFLFALAHLGSLFGALRNRGRILRSEVGAGGLPPSPLLIPAFAGGFLVCLLQLATALGFLESWLFFGYLLGMLWMLTIASWMFCDRLLDGLRGRPAG